MIRKSFIVAACAAALTFGGAIPAHADTSQGTDACLDGGNSTVITGMQCTPDTPSAAHVCANGLAHLTQGDHDYCPTQPKVVLVGEYELGTQYVPRIFPGTRLDAKMAPRSTKTNSFRCAHRYGGTLRNGVCRGVTVR